MPTCKEANDVSTDTTPALFKRSIPQPILFHENTTSARIGDGHTILFFTDDLEERPLPCRDLLELQGFLIHVLRLAGSAGDDI